MQPYAIKILELFERRNKLLAAISNLHAANDDQLDQDSLLNKCCEIILENEIYCLVWAGKRDEDGTGITPLVALTSANLPKKDCMNLVEQVVTDMHDTNPAARALLSGKPVAIQDITQETDAPSLLEIAQKTGFRSCTCWPLIHKGHEYGVLNIHSDQTNCFTGSEIEFLTTVTSDISLALYSLDVRNRLQIERDFNQEIVDTVQGLMVSISPCGMILSFNSKAVEVTGFSQNEVVGKYWVDILIAPEKRKEGQQLFSQILKGASDSLNFQLQLQTKDCQTRIINWHASIRPEIKKSKVGLVLFGIDITDQLQTDLALNQALNRWENIFTAIQDPALIVSTSGVILDANPATFAAARKEQTDVIGKQVCEILHDGRAPGAICPLEYQISLRTSRIFETELRGLHGSFLLTVSPLIKTEDNVEATLLVARDLTEEERMRAEAIRAAQLASVGELAAGVAHEINNPINGIINYAQIVLDDPGDPDNGDSLLQIIKEGKRVAGIVRNLLDFARPQEEFTEPVSLASLVHDSMELVKHQFKKDTILILNDLSIDLPDVICNGQQIQQVLLNVFSNARYALNKKYPEISPDKTLTITGATADSDSGPVVRLSISDNGIGIEQDIMDRLFDPFFSTKPNGEGTGLGLSISHGLIKENNGTLKISSILGKGTTITIDLPVPGPPEL